MMVGHGKEVKKMAYDLNMTQFLSGATKSQLNRWAREGILLPEINASRPKIYSFRDIVALRAISKLRRTFSLQKIRRALETLEDHDFTDHLSEYRFATDGKSVKVWTEDGFMDILANPGQWEFIGFESIYAPFENMKGRTVPDLQAPSEGISIRPGRLGGTPTLAGTRVPFDLVVKLEEDMEPEEIAEYYETVKPEAVANAIQFNRKVREVAS